MSLPPRILIDSTDQLGECALWCDREQALYWTDIDSTRLWRWNETDNRLTQWTMPEPLSSFALCEHPGRLLLGLASGIAMFDITSGHTNLVTRVEAHEPRTRINDGRCDPQGRFVFGMFNPEGLAIGGFYRVGPDLVVEQLPLPLAVVGNALAFSPDGRTLYYTDSPQRCIWRLPYQADGQLGTPIPWVQLSSKDGEPDGATVDAEGGLWTALWGTGCVVRFDAEGCETLRLSLPVSQPTCPVFGGNELDRLFVTTARKNREAEPGAGSVFELFAHGYRGLHAHRFKTQ